MMDYKELFCYIVLLALLSLYFCYMCSHTAPDYWLARDPIVCQKVKEK